MNTLTPVDDKELLELAAKAAGYDDATWHDMGSLGVVRHGFSEAMWSEKLYAENDTGYWNPLTDDGDALRLAVKLALDINLSPAMVFVGSIYGDVWHSCEPYNDDPLAATRRAIVRAAAEIGRTK